MIAMGTSFAPALWFLLVLAVIPLALWLFKRTPMGRLQGAGPIRVVSLLALGPQQKLVTIALGEGEQVRHLLLGVTPQQIQLLQELRPGEAPMPGAVAPSFGQLLARARGPQA